MLNMDSLGGELWVIDRVHTSRSIQALFTKGRFTVKRLDDADYNDPLDICRPVEILVEEVVLMDVPLDRFRRHLCQIRLNKEAVERLTMPPADRAPLKVPGK
ncbi:hypothetical protein MJO29_012433 [Puccinia striiformis f. sp. tritici]|nr:hypothetical protein MJO29_012433 [Puccinia striiformis f. sp. tritici]